MVFFRFTFGGFYNYSTIVYKIVNLFCNVILNIFPFDNIVAFDCNKIAGNIYRFYKRQIKKLLSQRGIASFINIFELEIFILSNKIRKFKFDNCRILGSFYINCCHLTCFFTNLLKIFF